MLAREYPYKPKIGLMLLCILFFGVCAAVGGEAALTNNDGTVHGIYLTPAGARIVYWVMFGLSLGFAIIGFFGVYISMTSRRRVMISRDKLSAPARAYSAKNTEIDLLDIRRAHLRILHSQRILTIEHKNGKLSLAQSYFASKAAFEEFVEVLGVKLKSIARPGAREEKTFSPRITFENPLVLQNPHIGFLNLLGRRGQRLMDEDQSSLSPLFSGSHISTDAVPKCQVLFIYAALGKDGRIAGQDRAVREILKEAGAYIGIVASVNPAASYMKLEPCEGWKANIVLTLDRNGDKFAAFFRELFELMFTGKTMPMAWVQLAPQIPGNNPDLKKVPGTMMLSEVGHILFKRDVGAP